MTPVLRGPTVWLTEQPPIRWLITEHPLGRSFALRFVAGDDLESGMAAADRLHGRGIAAMLDHLGENVTSASEAAEATDAYVRALKRLRETPAQDVNISVKLTQLGLDLSRDLCEENLEHVLQAADGAGPATLVMIDMEASAYVQGTLDIYRSVRSRHSMVGVCLQSVLRRTLADAHRIGGPQAIVRVVKGAYLEPPEVAFQRRADVDRAFAHVTATLLAGGATVHVATHDPALLEGARGFVRRRAVPADRYEFQLLYGIRTDLQGRLVAEGEPVRVYVPYGTHWYPYLTRRLAERPANGWFFASNALRGLISG